MNCDVLVLIRNGFVVCLPFQSVEMMTFTLGRQAGSNRRQVPWLHKYRGYLGSSVFLLELLGASLEK